MTPAFARRRFTFGRIHLLPFGKAGAAFTAQITQTTAVVRDSADFTGLSAGCGADIQYIVVRHTGHGIEIRAVGFGVRLSQHAGVQSEERESDTKQWQAPVSSNDFHSGLRFYSCQTDFDGTNAYSKIVAIAAQKAETNITLYPNPAQGIRYLKTQTAIQTPSQITVTDLHGKTILQTTAKAQELQTGFAIDLSGKPSGLYFICITEGNKTTVLRTLQP
jgi:hypothetical protein